MKPPSTYTTFPDALDEDTVVATRASLIAIAQRAIATGPYAARWTSMTGRSAPQWYRDAKFGIFIHWIPASVAAFHSEWYARNMYLQGSPEFEHHRKTYGDQTEFGFKDFLPAFDGSRFDATEWIETVVRAGARYVVPVAQHHDGFSLGHTELSRWSATRVGPRRDVLAELAAAAREAGVHFGLSNHYAENWWFFSGGTRFPSDVQDPQWRDLYGPARSLRSQPDEAFLTDWLARSVEAVERYDPDLYYFDWWIEQPAFAPYLPQFAAYFYNRAAGREHDVVLNYKWDAALEDAAVQDIERGSVPNIRPMYFQNDTSISRRGWCYLQDDIRKSSDELIADLIDTVSKNGALLLNIGPLPDGTIHPVERELLQSIGDWLAVNGDAVYGTTPWLVYGEGPTQPTLGSFSDGNRIPWTEDDIRFTCKGNTLYATAMNWNEHRELRIRSLGTMLRVFNGDIRKVDLLGSGRQLMWHRTGEALVIAPVAPPTSSRLVTVRIELAPEQQPPRIDAALPD